MERKTLYLTRVYCVFTVVFTVCLLCVYCVFTVCLLCVYFEFVQSFGILSNSLGQIYPTPIRD